MTEDRKTMVSEEGTIEYQKPVLIVMRPVVAAGACTNGPDGNNNVCSAFGGAATTNLCLTGDSVTNP